MKSENLDAPLLYCTYGVLLKSLNTLHNRFALLLNVSGALKHQQYLTDSHGRASCTCTSFTSTPSAAS